MSSIINSSLVRCTSPRLAALVASLLVSSLGFCAEPNQTLYKWDDASGRTHYTQTPPEANIPYEELSSLSLQVVSPTADTTLASNSSSPAQQDSSYVTEPVVAPPRKESTSFSSIPQNARVIPNKYNYGSTEYKVSPASAAIERSRND